MLKCAVHASLTPGIDPGKLIIGHSGDSTDLDYLRRLVDGGSILVLSHDAACHMDWLPDGLQEAAIPNWHFTLHPRLGSAAAA